MKKQKITHNSIQDSVAGSIDLVAAYQEAMNARSSAQMDSLRSPDFELDFVYGDAFQEKPMSGEATRSFWPVWFRAFPDGEFEPTRTIAAEKVVVVQWTFSGTHLGALGKPIIEPEVASTGRIVCFRGVSFYDIEAGRIRRETTYLDQATVLVELGATL